MDRTDDLRPVRLWLYAICAMVVAMVVIGGATRLTDSGLSITEWAPLRGAIPPLDAADWAAEFDKYRTTTEYQTVNAGMSLADFKIIYWWEWGHRQWGRLMGLAFVLPLAFFWVAGRLTPRLKPRLLMLLAMGASQGVIGWWMVKSGLVNRVDVSQYRLAAHLSMACIIFAYALWLARSILPATGDDGDTRVAWGAGGVTALVLIQIALGAFVAGMDAGLAYNTWPLMDGAWVPGGLAPTGEWEHVFDDVKTVQFIHRTGAYILFAAAWAYAAWAWLSAPGARGGATALALLVTGQALVGIVTLVTQVPLGWALAHQLGAILVLAVAIVHWRAAVPNERRVALPGGAQTA